MRKVLITGASGFIGRKTVMAALRQKDWQVHTVGRKSNYSFPYEVIQHRADLSNADECQQVLKEASPNAIIHLAWALAEQNYSEEVSNLIWLENSLRLLRYFFENGGRRFLFAGSASEYGEPGGRHVEESAPVNRTVYGESKAVFEQISMNYCRKHQYEFVSARCFPVYGEGDNRTFKAIYAAIIAFLKKETFICKGPNNVWDYIHVDDVADALVEIMASGYCGAVNVGTGMAHTMREVFQMIADRMGCPQLLLCNETAKNVTIQVADPRILNEKIGYSCKVNFGDGLDRTIAWWNAQYNSSEISNN